MTGIGTSDIIGMPPEWHDRWLDDNQHEPPFNMREEVFHRIAKREAEQRNRDQEMLRLCREFR